MIISRDDRLVNGEGRTDLRAAGADWTSPEDVGQAVVLKQSTEEDNSL